MDSPNISVLKRRPANNLVKFIVATADGGERTYEAEKRKLASASKVFSDMFEKEQSPIETNCITIKDFSPKAFKVMLRHVYKKQYCLDDWDLALEVFRVAEKYKMFSLQQECKDFFSRTPIRDSDPLRIYKMASKYNIHKVLSLCEEVFEKDSDVLMLTSSFEDAEKGTVRKIIRHKSELQPRQILALINWGRCECRRRKIPVNRANLEQCVISACGTSLAISVSKAIEKLETARRKSDINAKVAGQKPSSHTAVVSLCNSVSGTILDSFNMDIICEVKISVFNCTLEFTGVELHLKKSCLEESSLEVFYSTENLLEKISISDTKVGDTMGERKEVAFSQGLIVKSGQIANITVRIEELQMSHCLHNSKVQQVFIDKTKGIHFKLEFRSNQASSVHQGPFFIEKLFYKSLPG